MSAYLVMSFVVVKGIPRFRGVGIYSEPASTLTRFGGIEYADLMEWQGNSYGECHDDLVTYISSQVHMAWMLPWVSSEPEHKKTLEEIKKVLKRI